MSAEYISYQTQKYERAPMSSQQHGNVVEFRPRETERDEALRIELGDRAHSLLAIETDNHTNDEAMRDVDLDRTTAAAREHKQAVAAARRAAEASFSKNDFYSD